MGLRFQVLFHSPPGVLFAFPSRYFCAIGRISSLALDRGRPGFKQDFSCPALLRYYPTESIAFRVRGFHPLCQAFPKPFSYSVYPVIAVLQPHPFRWFGLFQFRSPLLSESLLISFPRVLRWFSSPSFASALYLFKYG